MFCKFSKKIFAGDFASFFLPLIWLYSASFAACFGHVVRYTPSPVSQIVSVKLQIFGKVNL